VSSRETDPPDVSVDVLCDVTRFLWRLYDFFSPRPGGVSSQLHTGTQLECPSPFYVMKIRRLVKMAEEILEFAGKDVPKEYLCPIGLTVMTIPVITCTGYTFELENLEQWLQNSENKCPVTRQETRIVARNLILQDLIEEWANGVITQWENLPPPVSEQDSVSISPAVCELDSLSMEVMVELRHDLNRKFASVSHSDENREGEWESD
jgi:hypothetical protein